MKKTTLLRETAYVSAPQMADGFVPPAGFDYKISVSLHEVDVKIYGFDGQSWSLLHDTDGTIPSYIADIQHQKYYLESKTGSEQTVRVSFLSSEDEDSGIRTGGTPGNTRFYDIEEIPVYNGSRDGAMLTVMSDGSLAWLLVNESFIIPEESSAPTYSELTPVGGAVVDDGQIQTNGGYFSALWSDFVSFTGDTPDNTDFTVAFWWKSGETPYTPANQWDILSDFGLFNGRVNSMNEGMTYFIKDNSTSGIRLQTNFGASFFTDRENMVSKDANIEHPWNHFVLTRTATHTKTYWNGVQVASHGANFPWVPNSATAQIQIGATDENGANSSQNTLFEDFEIRDGEAMSQADITTLFDAGRQSQVGAGGNVIAGTFLEDISTVIARQSNKISSGIYTDNSHGGSTGMSVLLKDDGILAYDPNTNETVNDEFTISWWMNLDASQAASNLGLAGINVGQVNGVVRRFAFDLGGGSSLINPHFISYTRNPKTTNNLGTGVSMSEVWTHVAIVIKNDSSNTVGSIYLNGSKLNNGFSYPLGTKVFPPSTQQEFKFGAGFQSKSVKGQFDSMQIADGVALTDSQVAAIAGQSDRQMSIETAAAS
jgi:hypothetical protein